MNRLKQMWKNDRPRLIGYIAECVFAFAYMLVSAPWSYLLILPLILITAVFLIKGIVCKRTKAIVCELISLILIVLIFINAIPGDMFGFRIPAYLLLLLQIILLLAYQLLDVNEEN